MTDDALLSPPGSVPLPTAEPAQTVSPQDAQDVSPPKPARLEPTRYGDWELNGKCVDF